MNLSIEKEGPWWSVEPTLKWIGTAGVQDSEWLSSDPINTYNEALDSSPTILPNQDLKKSIWVKHRNPIQYFTRLAFRGGVTSWGSRAQVFFWGSLTCSLFLCTLVVKTSSLYCSQTPLQQETSSQKSMESPGLLTGGMKSRTCSLTVSYTPSDLHLEGSQRAFLDTTWICTLQESLPHWNAASSGQILCPALDRGLC